MRVFISGVMQGSREDHDVHAQDYRQLLSDALRARYPHLEILDPWAMHPGAVEYSPQQARKTLLQEIELAGTCDLLIAYVPQASMGTSLEIWAAFQTGVPIFTISKMTRNWVIQSFSTVIQPTLEDFLAHVETGGLDHYLDGPGAAG